MDSPVTIDPQVMSGTPCFAGTRVPVRTLFDYLSHGHALDEFLDDFPTVSRELALAVLKLAGEKTAAGSGSAAVGIPISSILGRECRSTGLSPPR